MKIKPFIAVPTYSGMLHFTTFQALMGSSVLDPMIQFFQFSMTTLCFNALWASALNQKKTGVTHFAMCHDDITPEAGWLDKMLAIMEREKCHILSAVSPLKNESGLTSTAVDNDTWNPPRFTLRQLSKMPSTFTSPKLLLNTGLMLVDIRETWVDTMLFDVKNAMLLGEKGFSPIAFTEDWLFSRKANALGKKLCATTEVKLTHCGSKNFANFIAGGYEEIDSKNGEAKL